MSSTENSEAIFMACPSDAIEQVYPGFRHFFRNFYPYVSKYHKIRELDLPDIWTRDFLPVQNLKNGKLFQLFFKPCYANYNEDFSKKIRESVRSVFPNALPLDLRIDGGNIVCSPENIAFCFERQTIWHKNNECEKIYAENCLKTALGTDRIIWLEKEIGDKICHIDGFMQFLGNYLMVSDERFDDYLAELLEKRISAVKRAIPDIRIEFLPCCTPEGADYLNACGVYVNFLETSKAVFVPQYGIDADKKAMKIISSFTDKPAIGIDCSQICVYGGAVHCLTREYSVFIKN